MNKQTSRVALVTGACGGIGKALVNKYISQDISVAVADKSKEEVNMLVEEIQRNGGMAMAFPGDLIDKITVINCLIKLKNNLGV